MALPSEIEITETLMYQRTCYDSLGSHLILFYGPDFFLTHILFKNILRRLPVAQLWCMIREFSFYWASKQEMIVMRIHVIREWKVLEGRCCLWIERMPCTQTNIFMKFYMKIWWFSFECFLPFNFFQPKDWLPIYFTPKALSEPLSSAWLLLNFHVHQNT